MKRYPECGRTFTNNTLLNCLHDGMALVEDVPAPPPYFGAPSAAPQRFAETPLSAIPELQSPEMQSALKEALDKAGMSGLLDAGSAHSTVSIKTSVTTGPSGMPFDTGTLPSAFTGVPSPAYIGSAAPARRGCRAAPEAALPARLIPLLSAVFLVINGLRVFWHQFSLGVPAGSAAAAKKH